MSETTEMDGNDTNAEASHVSNNPRSRKLRSLVWNDFAKEQMADGSYVAVCNYCKKHLTASSRSGTTHLKNHLGVCQSSKRSKRKKLMVHSCTPKLADSNGDRNFSTDRFLFDEELSRQDLARMIVLHGYPLSIVQHVGFRTFVSNLQPLFRMVTYDAVKADCLKIYDGAKLKLQQLLDKISCRVNLTIDMWRSNEGTEYVCLTCHYVDNDWKFQKKILNFLHVESLSTGEEISEAILEKLYEWNLDRRMSSFIVDNSNFGDVIANDLLKFVRSDGFNQGNPFHAHYCAHVLNLIVQDGLQLASVLTDKVRDCVLHVKSSLPVFKKFQNAIKEVGAPKTPLIVDVQTSWSSTYLMLETASQFQHAFVWPQMIWSTKPIHLSKSGMRSKLLLKV